MRLHPNAAVRVLRNELTMLEEARLTCADKLGRLCEPERVRIDHAMLRIRQIHDVRLTIEAIDAEALEVQDALMILEAGLEIAPVLSDAEAVFA